MVFPRNTYGTEFSGIQWLHHLFPSMLAYAISQAITRIVAFLGMYLLLKSHFIKEKDGDCDSSLGSTCVCANSILAIWYAKYSWDAACVMGLFEY